MTTNNRHKVMTNAHLVFEVKFSPFSLKSKIHLITGDMLWCNTYNDSIIDKLINQAPLKRISDTTQLSILNDLPAVLITRK